MPVFHSFFHFIFSISFSGGTLLLEADPRQMEDIAAVMKHAGFRDVQTYADLSGQQRVIGAVLSQ